MISVVLTASALCIFFVVHFVKKWNQNRKVMVNCWFCGEDSCIKYRQSSWWFCHVCEQNNGFKQNGDYKELIPEMFSEPPNTQKFCVSDVNEQSIEKEDILCLSCQNKQTFKLNDISMFVPSREDAFDEEFNVFKVGLENKYKLCFTCQKAVTSHLQLQDYQIRRTYCFQNEASDKAVRKLQTNMLSSNSSDVLAKSCHLLSFIAAFWLYLLEYKDEFSCFLLNFITAIHVSVSLLIISCKSELFWWGFISTALWISMAMQRNYEKQESQQLFYYILSLTICLECMIFVHALINTFISMRKKWKYLNQRKRKIEGARNAPKFPSLDSNELELRKYTSSYEDNCLSSNIQEGQLNSVTPDLLHGHLDAMYIERVPSATQERNNGETNHVVAALRYMPNKRTSSSAQPKPLIRPATFVWKSKSSSEAQTNRSQLEEEKSKVSNNEVKAPSFTDVNSESDEDTTDTICLKNQKPFAVRSIISSKHWWIIIIVCFALSVSCNVYLIASQS